MSYILEALKKSELQRGIGQVPGIGSEHEKPGHRVTGKWLWVATFFLVLNLVLLAVLLWPDYSVDSGKGYDTDLVRTDPVIREQTVVSAPPAVVPPPVVPAARSTVPDVVVPVAPAPEIAAPEPAAEPVVESQDPAQRITEQVPAVRPEEDTAAEMNSLPVWPQIPGHLFQQLNGGIRLDVHVYSDLPQDRFVLINLQKYHAGDQLQEGPLLDEITPEGVILSYRGQRFRIRAQ